MDDPKSRAVWLDGGCGVQNLPLWEAFVECRRRGWLDDGNEVHMLALGCGRTKFWMGYKEATKGLPIARTLRAVRYFNSLKSGSLARNQATMVQVKNMQAMTDTLDNFTFQFVDWADIPKKLDKMDNIKARYQYLEKGEELGRSIDIDALRK
jgi:hypothetical protein